MTRRPVRTSSRLGRPGRCQDGTLEGGTIRIERTLTYAGGELRFGAPKSAAGERTLVAPTFVLEALRRHRAAQNERRLLYGAAWKAERDLVCDYGDGGPWLPPTFSTYLVPVREPERLR